MTPRVVLLVTGDYVLTVVLVKGTLLVLALLLVRLFVGRRSAATRSALWTVAAAGLLLLPVLQHVVPVTPLSLLAFPTFLFQPDVGDIGRGGGVSAGSSAGALFGWITAWPPAVWMATAWFAGAVLLLGRFVRNLAGVRRLARDSDPMPPARLHECLGKGDDRTHASARVRYSRAVTSPVTFGWWRPVILFPVEARTWPAERLASALSHEFAHVRRRDYLVLVLTEVLRAVYWPNPLIWRVTSLVRTELEHACDDAVLRAGVNRIDYARHLLELASGQRMAPTVGALPMVRRSFFCARMRAILDDRADRAPVSRHVLLVAGVLWLLVVSGLGGVGLWTCSGQTAPPAPAQTSNADRRPAAG